MKTPVQFRQEDVGLLLDAAACLEKRSNELDDRDPQSNGLYSDAEDLRSLAARIQALLPPEEK